MRVCRCGAIVEKRCDRCEPPRHRRGYDNRTTAERGYDNQWRKLSERYRAKYPLCERCEEQGRVTAAEEVHHKVPINVDASRRLDWSNLMSVCRKCHREIEGS